MQAILHTSKGDIRLDLYPEAAPKTVANFVGLARGTKPATNPATGHPAKGPFYDGTIFHRVISGFMIQGGDPLGVGTGGPGYTFDDEIDPNLTFSKPYLLAMANAGLRGGRGTNGSQFFITVDATDWLTGKHTIFGEVADQASRDVVDAIAASVTGRNDKPLEDVVIQTVELVEAD
jgi:peptidyl-prolyl cis-trans isomerase A (cyclophilin A)